MKENETINDSNLELINLYFQELVEKGNLDIIPQIIHPDYSRDIHSPLVWNDSAIEDNYDTYVERINKWAHCFSSKILAKEILPHSNILSAFVEFEIFQKAKWFDLEPQNKCAKIMIAYRFEIKDGKIISIRTIIDYHKFWGSLGHPDPLKNVKDDDYLTYVKKLKFND